MSSLLSIFTPRRAAATALMVALVGSAPIPARAAEASNQPTEMALTGIMRDLGKEMEAVTDAIAREDWPRVATLATQIADHPQPPLAEKLRILAFVGKDTSRFRDYDKQTHEAAQLMAQAARRRDGNATITAFANVQTACLGCHQQFRKPFQDHFHDQH